MPWKKVILPTIIQYDDEKLDGTIWMVWLVNHHQDDFFIKVTFAGKGNAERIVSNLQGYEIRGSGTAMARDFLFRQPFEPNKVRNFLEILAAEDKQVSDIIEDIKFNLGILTVEDLKHYPPAKAINLAQTQKADYNPHLLWQLIDYYYANSFSQQEEKNPGQVSLSDLYKLANGIPKGNHHYHTAQDYCVNILKRQADGIYGHLDKADQIFQPEYRKNLKLMLKHALEGSRQQEINRVFNELTNHETDSEKSKTANVDIKGDYDTLIYLADKLFELSSAYKKLQTQITPQQARPERTLQKISSEGLPTSATSSLIPFWQSSRDSDSKTDFPKPKEGLAPKESPKEDNGCSIS